MLRILQAFTATSIPTGTFLLLTGMAAMGANPSLDSVKTEEPQELWATLQLPLTLELDLDSPDSVAVQSSASAPSLGSPKNAAPVAEPDAPAFAADTEPAPKPRALAPSSHSKPAKPFAGHLDGSPDTAVSKAPPKRHAEGVSVSNKVPQKKGGSCMEHTDAIVKISSNNWTVKRSFLEALASDRQAASRLAVLTWNNTTKGQVDGFKVRRVRCGSPLHQAGFRNGDVVHGVNGHAVTSLAEAAWTYGQVRKDSKLKVNLTRRDGTVAKLRYTVE